MAGDPTATQFPPMPAKITIHVGPFIHVEYEGPVEFLKDLPALIEELRKAIPEGASLPPPAPPQ